MGYLWIVNGRVNTEVRWKKKCYCHLFTTNPTRNGRGSYQISQVENPSATALVVPLYCGRVPAANAPGCTAAEGLLYKPWSLVLPTCTAKCLPTETLLVKGGTIWARNGRWILPENARLPHNNQGSFTCRKSTTWDKRLYFPSEGRRAEDFFALKNPTASAGFQPVNLGTKGQHPTSRPPKPLWALS